MESGFFELITPEDLLEKLRWEYEKIHAMYVLHTTSLSLLSIFQIGSGAKVSRINPFRGYALI